MEKERIEELERKISSLEEDVARLKSLVYKTNSPRPKTVHAPPKQREETTKRPAQTAAKSSQAIEEPVDWEKVLFQTWLPRIFIFVFIIGVLWGFKAASDYGLMNEKAKVVLGFAVSIGFAVTGHFQIKKGRLVLGQVLVGGAIPILMLTTFAMHSLYHLAGPMLAFILNASWIILGIIATVFYRSQALGIISAVGGVLVPFLIESNSPNALVFIGYETLLYIAFLYVAIKQKYSILYVLSAVLLNLTLLIYYSFVGDNGVKELLGMAILIQHLCLISSFFLSQSVLQVYAFTLLSSLAVTYGWLLAVFDDGTTTMVLLALVIIYALGVYAVRSSKEKFEFFITYLIVAVAFFIHQLVDLREGVILYVIQGLAVYYIAMTYKNLLHQLFSYTIYILSATYILVTPIERVLSLPTLNWIVVLASIPVFIWISIQKTERDEHDIFKIGGSIVFSILSLIFATEVTVAGTNHLSTNPQTLIMTAVWLGMSIAAFVIGSLKTFKTATYIGVGILFLTLFKLILYDLPFIPMAIRALLFIVLGAIGLIISRLFYKKK
ncbi:DUF2339 domain-containing protein [Priestia sp. YIM B13446]|jgi:uncharacterized membrane protein|uniref:DUF2339 domain-containing protein n=1 Tax=Priestia TaxID=2800373 RepID=UPI00076282E4|nr:DUF2339 domain-containing protein [Priestia megaterium]KWU64054.1 hypothetical protein AWX17_02290 [Priestia megaterium]MCM3151979.1 DUF2339 domain-containing protein [Priestia megaterium]MCP1451599.1 putative membrane protein [Priestia megaterium]MDC7722150.1 DUF2339 domain-containing protein [Priestia megaterium]MED4047237.1 DUF2339 domain-containing protein [Priestia megaterium]